MGEVLRMAPAPRCPRCGKKHQLADLLFLDPSAPEPPAAKFLTAQTLELLERLTIAGVCSRCRWNAALIATPPPGAGPARRLLNFFNRIVRGVWRYLQYLVAAAVVAGVWYLVWGGIFRALAP